MKVVGVRVFGGPERLEVLELPDPQAGPGEVQIRVHAAAVNPTDTLIRSGAPLVHSGDRQPAEPPYVPGMDAAGVVEQVGPDVGERLDVGQRVVALLVPYGSHGGYAEQVVVPAASVVPAPAGAEFPAAATLLMNAMTARLAVDELALSSGDTLAVSGAAGSVGGSAVQLGKLEGLHVIADARPSDVDLVCGFGADDVVERGDDVAVRSGSGCPAVSQAWLMVRCRTNAHSPRSRTAERLQRCGGGPVRRSEASRFVRCRHAAARPTRRDWNGWCARPRQAR